MLVQPLQPHLSKIPSIFHIHEIPIGSKLYTKFLTKIFNLFSSKIIVVSNSTRDFWIKKGVVHNKILVINNGFNFDFSSIKKIKLTIKLCLLVYLE